MNETAREVIKHISDAALELAFVRHDLTSDQVDVDDDADVKERVAAHEAWFEDVKGDVLNCLTGDDTGCLDPEELDESNCELLWLASALTTVQQEARAAAFTEMRERIEATNPPLTFGSANGSMMKKCILAELEAAANSVKDSEGEGQQ